VHVITAATVRLDQAADRTRLEHNIAQLKPRLLVLDPFVRLHRIDENASGEVAPLLAYLRTLQRQHHLAVLVVHHARKSAGRVRAGQALRGSSEFHAWGDSNLYLRRSGGELTLTVEHRAAPSPPTIVLELAQRGVVMGQGDSYEAALADAKSSAQFHIESFGGEAFDDDSDVEAAYVAEGNITVV
jgi:RecA-family ATPase